MQSIAILLILSSCSFFLPSTKTKNAKASYQMKFVPNGWSEHKTDRADYYFQGPHGASLIAQSFCNEFQNDDLKKLAANTFRSLDSSIIKQQKSFTLKNREALETRGEASMDGVKVNLALINTRRNNCYYDFFEILPLQQKSMIDEFIQSVEFK